MSFLTGLTLFGLMLALAATPSASVALVVGQSASGGLRNGIATIAGIVMGDLLFIFIAIAGLTALALTLGPFFAVLQYLGGAYLVWLGLRLVLTQSPRAPSPQKNRRASLAASFTAGFFLTLGDLKAILFYASLFPALLDLKSLSPGDIALIALLTILTVGGVKFLYALAAESIAGRMRSSKFGKLAQRVAGGLLLGSGAYLLTKA